MISRDDFIFTVGYQGDTAIVDASAKKRNKGLTASELASKGLFKQAFSAALFDGDKEGMQKILEDYNRIAGTEYEDLADLKRLFGVDGVREDISRTKAL